jgi:guanylate kinase
VIEPVAGTSRTNGSGKLISFAPDNLFNVVKPPSFETLAPRVNRTARDPQEEYSFRLDIWDIEG